MGDRAEGVLIAVGDVPEALLSRVGGVASDSFRQQQVVEETGHRPWPIPDRPWLMGQTWKHLLFAHWAVPPESLATVVPSQLPLDTRDGSAWLGVTPFFVTGLRLRGTVPPPLLSAFAELNLRTYVSVEGKPGIYFLSLDAASRAAVFAARRSYRLPYFHARIDADVGGKGVFYDLQRRSGDGPPARFRARYRPVGPLLPPRPGSLERWLTERYCLYTLDQDGRIQRGEIHHPPWPLRAATAEIELNSMATPFGIAIEEDPLLHFSARQHVALWSIRPLRE